MDFLSRLIGVGASQSRKPNSNDPQHRLARFKKIYTQTLQVWHRTSPKRQDQSAIESIRQGLQKLTTLLSDDTRAPAPHLCLSFAASSQFYVLVTRIALSLQNEDIIREAVGFFSALVDSDEENLLSTEKFAEALMTLVDNISGSGGFPVGAQIEGEILELIFGIAAKIRLEPELLPVWFLPEEDSEQRNKKSGGQLSVGDSRRFPLCYQFIGHVYHEGRAGDFARTGLLYIFESVTSSPELERWIIESDLPTLMASGLGALYSQLNRKLAIAHPKEGLPLILALSDREPPVASAEIESFYSEQLQARLSTFMSNLIFWQDILEHCRSLEIKQTLIDHFQIFFLQQILYPSLLESSDVDGGSSVAVLTYLWRILDSVDHPDLIHLILSYLLALSERTATTTDESRPLSTQKRKSLLSLTQVDGGEDRVTPSFFNLVDLIQASIQSTNSETITASLRLITVLLMKHHSHAFSNLMRVTTFNEFGFERNMGAVQKETNMLIGLARGIGGKDGLDESYENCLKDALSMIESHTCSTSRLGMRRTGLGAETRARSAILEDNTRHVVPHYLVPEDPLLQSLLRLVTTFLTNDIETNLGLTNVLSHLAACPYSSLEGWLVTNPSKYRYNLPDHQLDGADQPGEEDTEGLTEEDMDKAEEARVGAFKAACMSPEWDTKDASALLQIFQTLEEQLRTVRETTPELDQLIAGRKRAFQGANEIEAEARNPMPTIASPRLSAATSRDTSRSRVMSESPVKQQGPVGSPASALRGRAMQAVAGQRKDRPTSPSPLNLSTRGTPIKKNETYAPKQQPGLSISPTKLSQTLSPLAAVTNVEDEDNKPPTSSHSVSSAASVDTEIFERKIKFPAIANTYASEAKEKDELQFSPDEEFDNTVAAKEEAPREASLNHVLTNIVILQEFVLELTAFVQVRASFIDGEVKFL
ncbi:MAG: hypothetical protein M1831_002189 [Alyxoria varia]|nr:MAG: hypothetical protein M1831_002189 [Alyxoria varia]